MQYRPSGRSRWLNINSCPFFKGSTVYENKNRREKNKKKEANIQPLDQKSLLLLVFYIYMAKIKWFPAGNSDRAVNYFALPAAAT